MSNTVDPYINGAHADHYIRQAGAQHDTIVRFQERCAALEAENALLRAELAERRAGVSTVEASLPLGTTLPEHRRERMRPAGVRRRGAWL